MGSSTSFADRVTAHYFEELSSRFAIVGAASTPLTISTALIAANATILLALSQPFSWTEWLVIPPAGLDLGLLGFAFYHLARLHAGYVYDHTATMGEFVRDRNDYVAKGATERQADTWASHTIVDQYAACATVNASNNELKAWHLHKCWTWLLWACFLFALTAGAYINHKWNHPDVLNSPNTSGRM